MDFVELCFLKSVSRQILLDLDCVSVHVPVYRLRKESAPAECPVHDSVEEGDGSAVLGRN